jgi:hypothetical protein
MMDRPHPQLLSQTWERGEAIRQFKVDRSLRVMGDRTIKDLLVLHLHLLEPETLEHSLSL